MNWELRSFCDIVQFPPKVQLIKGESYPFIPMDVLSSGIKYVSALEKKDWKGSGGAKFENGDTLFARITPCLQNGKICQVKGLEGGKGFGSTEFFVYRGIEGISDTNFIYYLSLTEEFRGYAIGSMVGASGRQRADATFVGKYEFLCPPLPIQKRIAEILSAYDDLIENNLKRIKLLEELAQRTYEEWFVRFRVNGEQLPIDESTGLPVGWEKRKLPNVANITFGYPFKGNDFNQEKRGTPIIRIRNIPASETQDYTTEVADEKYKIKAGDLLVGMDGEFYINNWYGKEAYLVQRSCKIAAKNGLYNAYIGQAIVKPIKFYEATISGATVAHLGKKHLDEIELIIPDSSCEPTLVFLNELLAQKIILGKQNSLLKQSRDILLPRLMNGTINVT